MLFFPLYVLFYIFCISCQNVEFEPETDDVLLPPVVDDLLARIIDHEKLTSPVKYLPSRECHSHTGVAS